MSSSTTAFAFVLTLAVAAHGHAADRLWIPPAGGSFSATSSWSGGALPGPSDNAIFGQSTVTTPFNVTFPVTPLWVSNLTISNQKPQFQLSSSGAPKELHVVNDLRIRSGTLANPVMFIDGSLFATVLFVGFDGSANSGYVTLANVAATCTNFSVGFGSPGATGVVTLNAGTTLHKLACCDGEIGSGVGNSGTLNVDDSTLIHEWALRVGRGGGVGNLNVSNGGHVEIGAQLPLYIGEATGQASTGSCSVSTGGSISSYDIPIGIGEAASGTMTVDGASIEANKVSVGLYKGDGLLGVTSGGHVVSNELLVGRESGVGVLNVTGVTTFVRGLASIGLDGLNGPQGTVNLSGGCHVSSLRLDGTGHFVFLGIGSGAHGVANVAGTGTLWDGIDRLTVGGVYHTNTGGTGELHVSNGARVVCSTGIIADRPSDTGLVTVAGVGSEWFISGELAVGNFNGDGGAAIVEVHDGGRVSCTTFGMGQSGACKVALGQSSNSTAIVASGGAILAGSLVVSTEPGFVPAPGASYPLIQAASFSGAFTSVTLPPNMVLETGGNQLRAVQLDTITSINIAPSPITSLIGIATPLAAVAQFASGGSADVSAQATWSVENPAVASVSSTGVLMPLVAGSTNVTAGFQGVIGSAGLVVSAPPDPLPTDRVSVSAAGVQGNLPSSFSPLSMTADGRFVVFASEAQNLLIPATSGLQVFLKDTLTGGVELISQSSQGAIGNGPSLNPSISADGRYVVFESGATNLADTAPTAMPQVYVRDRQSSSTTGVSIGAGGAWANDGSQNQRISGNGRYVTFDSAATNLVSGDRNAQVDVFRRDLATGTTVVVSSLSGVPADGASDFASMDASGRFVAFGSTATNLVSGDTNGLSDIFLKDVELGTITRLSVGPSGEQALGGKSYVPVLSGDATTVGFLSFAMNLVPGGSNADRQIYARDLLTGVTTMLSRTERGDPSIGGSGSLSVSGDGRYVAFRATDGLTSTDTNGVDDIYRYSMTSGALDRISISLPGGLSNGPSLNTALDETGYVIAFNSDASNLVPFDTNGGTDTFLRRLPAAPIGDLDGDGAISASDLAILLGSWGGGGPADLTGDGIVDAADLATMLGLWTP